MTRLLKHIMNLPDEILLSIFSQPCLTTADRIVLAQVCLQWERLIGDYTLWKKGDYLMEKEACYMDTLLPAKISLKVHVKLLSNCVPDKLRRVLRRVTHLKWFSPKSMGWIMNHSRTCPLLTHVQIGYCDAAALATALPQTALTLRVLFLEDLQGLTTDARASVMAAVINCQEITHLKAPKLQWNKTDLAALSGQLIYLESGISSLDYQMHGVIHKLRYLYLTQEQHSSTAREWQYRLQRGNLVHFSIRFKIVNDFEQQYIQGHLIEAILRPLSAGWYNGGTCMNCHTERTFTFDTIDEAI